MLSRVAHSIYWMTRYIERAENIARFINVNLNLSLDFSADNGNQWQPIIMASGDHTLFEKNTVLIFLRTRSFIFYLWTRTMPTLFFPA